MPQRKRLLFFLTVGLLTVAVGFIPDLVSDELKAWCLQRFGPSYPWYFISLFVAACFFLVALSGEFKDLLSFNRQAKNRQQIKIAWSKAGKECLKSAREKLHQAALEESIKTLSELKNDSIEAELSLLSVRLAQYRQDDRLGTLSSEQKETAFSRISKHILDLIKTIEKQLTEGEKETHQLRDAFRQRYRDRLDQKLAFRQPVNLRRFATTEGTSEQVAATFLPYTSEEIREEIGKTFQEAHGRLLIVGQPGAGKTTLLLQLADNLFDLEEDALPVVLNLATWQSSFGKMETWLETVLASELSTNKAGAKAVLRQSNLILLLDGLDELKEDEAINSCLVAIADFGAEARRRFVITCRIEEYKRVQEDARVNLQIEVGPLQGEQLEAELRRMGREQPEALPLLQAIQKDSLLRQAIETSFYFNTLQLLFAGRLPVFTSTDLESRKAEITQKFVAAALQNTHNKAYPSESATHWLSFLASRMNGRNMVVFELRDLQYDWWQGWSRWNLRVANFIYGLTFSMVAWLTFSAVVGLVALLVVGLLFYGPDTRLIWVVLKLPIIVLVPGIGFAIVTALFVGLTERTLPEITTRDFVHWSTKEYLTSLNREIALVLVVALVASLIYGLVAFAVALIVILVLLADRLGRILENEFSDFIQIKSPYQRFYASMKVLYFSILQHWHLCRLFYKKEFLPLDLVEFLNEMAARHLLETDGATWRFRHRIIQDYFAGLWEEKAGQDDEEKA